MIRVLLADDQSLVHAGFRSLLDSRDTDGAADLARQGWIATAAELRR